MSADKGETPSGPAPHGAAPGGGESEAARSALARLRDWGGEPLVREMAAIFLTDMPRRLAAGRAALSAGDGAGVALAAHAMKSSCGQLGAVALAALCGNIESLARSGELARVTPLLEAADTELARFCAWLDRSVSSVSGAAGGRPSGGAMTTIAVVEDNPDNRLLLRAILEELYELEEYETGAQALEGFRRSRPSVVLLDISLPGIDGLEVLSRIRADEGLRDLPVIALTAHAMAGERDKYLDAGFDDYIAKPIVDEGVLLRAIARFVEAGL